MAPITQTAEYRLLQKLVDNLEIPVTLDLAAAIDKALSDGYVRVENNRVFITDTGYDRYDTLNDR
jgi:hypothetical protein